MAARDYESDFEAAKSPAEERKVVEDFLADAFAGFDLSAIKETLIYQIETLGFDFGVNPFLTFVETYFEKNGAKGDGLTRESYAKLNNMRVDGLVTDDALMAKTADKDAHVIFNKTLYFNRKNSDIEFMVKTYEWFGKDNRYQIKEYVTDQETFTVQGPESKEFKKSQVMADASALRDFIVFEGGDPNGKVRGAKDAEAMLRSIEKAQTKGQPAAQKTVKVASYVKASDRWSALTKSLTADDKSDLMAFLAGSKEEGA